jgi:uncharacterized protein with GYD domain
MLASRARGRIRLGTPTAAADAAAREVIDAFYAAIGRGDRPRSSLVGRVTIGTGFAWGGGWCSRPGRVYDLQTAMASRGGISMTLYMYQASYTAKSMAAQLTDPHDPMEAIGPTLEDVGATIVVAGFPFGEYDVLIVYEAPDDVTAASVAMAVAAAGEVKSAKTTRLLSGQEWLESLRKRRIVTRNLRQPHDRPGQMPESS